MSDEEGQASGTVPTWQPVAVVGFHETSTEPPKYGWRSFACAAACAATSTSLFWGWANLSNAYNSVLRAEPPLRTITLESFRRWAITGAAFLAVGSILLGCLIGLWIADLRQQRTQKQSADP